MDKDFVHDTALSKDARFLWILLASYCSPDSPQPYPSIKTLCRLMGVTKDTLAKYTRELVERGCLMREQRNTNGEFRSNTYTLIDHEAKPGMETPEAPTVQEVTAKPAKGLKDAVAIDGDCKEIIAELNAITGRKYRASESNLTLVRSRLQEPDVSKDGVLAMIRRQCAKWKGTDMEEYLRPETLFRKSKFDSYYAAKDLPLNGQKPKVAVARDEEGKVKW